MRVVVIEIRAAPAEAETEFPINIKMSSPEEQYETQISKDKATEFAIGLDLLIAKVLGTRGGDWTKGK